MQDKKGKKPLLKSARDSEEESRKRYGTEKPDDEIPLDAFTNEQREEPQMIVGNGLKG